MSGSNCCFLTCIQISQQSGQVVWYSHLLKNFPQFVVIHTVKGFGIVNKEEVDGFIELSCLFVCLFFCDPVDVGILISDSSGFSKFTLNIWKFLIQVLLNPGLENFDYFFATVWDECNCGIVWTFFGIAFLWDWSENWHFPVLWPLLSIFQICWHIECSTLTASSFKIWNSSTDFPARESGKGTENPQRIWLQTPVGFDYRIYIGLGKQTLGGHKQNFVCTRTQRLHTDWTRTVLERLLRRIGSAVACCRGRGTHFSSVCKGHFEGSRYYIHYF